MDVLPVKPEHMAQLEAYALLHHQSPAEALDELLAESLNEQRGRESRLSRFVLDALVVLTWCFPDEQSQKAEIVAQQIASGDVPIVTACWAHDVLKRGLFISHSSGYPFSHSR